MGSLLKASDRITRCSVEFVGCVGSPTRSRNWVRWLFSFDDWGLHYRKNSEEWKTLSDAPHELKVAAACLCAGLMPPSYFADLLEDHRPDLAEAAQFLREWELLKGERK